jgi:hypothetical protein
LPAPAKKEAAVWLPSVPTFHPASVVATCHGDAGAAVRSGVMVILSVFLGVADEELADLVGRQPFGRAVDGGAVAELASLEIGDPTA